MRALVAAVAVGALACGRVNFDRTLDAGTMDAVGADSIPLCTGPLTTSFDALPGPLLESSSMGGTAVLESERLILRVPSTPSAHASVRTGTISMAGRSIAMRVIKTLGTTNGETTIGVHNAGTTTESFHLFYDSTGFYAQKNTTAGAQRLEMTTYSPTTHAWWRIGENAGTFEIATSQDGQTWNALSQQPVFFDMTMTYVDIGVTVRSATAVADEAQIDDMSDCP